MLEQSDGWSSSNSTDSNEKVDLVAAIADELSSCPIDDSALRQYVWIYVGAERNRGTNPGKVIITLTELVEKALISPAGMRQALMRSIILWCVEAYFGHLGGDVHADAGATTTGEMMSQNISVLGREHSTRMPR